MVENNSQIKTVVLSVWLYTKMFWDWKDWWLKTFQAHACVGRCRSGLAFREAMPCPTHCQACIPALQRLSLPGTLEAMLHIHLQSPILAPEWPDDQKSHLGETEKPKGIGARTCNEHVLTPPLLGISISWTMLEPGVVACGHRKWS